uniref:Major facilitator superfamily domain containing 2B n=1 Tax=Cyprinus carpio TaxID=7962 RepID=A0A8C1TU84_CYPCA
LITCFHVPYSALTMFLSIDQCERDSATAYRKLTHTTVLRVIKDKFKCVDRRFPSLLMICFSSQKEVYMIAAGVISGLFLVCTVVMFLGVKERDGEYKAIPFHKGFILVMKHGSYLTLTAAFLFISVAIQLIQSNFVLFCTYAVELRDHFQNIVLTILMSAAVSIPFWQWFLEKFGKKTAAFCGITVNILCADYKEDLALRYQCPCLIAMMMEASAVLCFLLLRSMLPDVVDDFRLANRSSKGHEAIFYSLYAFFTKFAAGISLGVSTLCLQFAGYDTGACRQPPPVVYTLKLLIGAAPVVCITTGLMILLVYPISEDVRLRNKLALEELSTNSTLLNDIVFIQLCIIILLYI